MPLKHRYDSLEQIPEALREYYTERNGKFILDVDESDSLGALARALEHERNNHRQVKERYADVDDQLRELEELRQEKKKQAEKGMMERGEFDKLLAERLREQAKDYESKMGKVNKRAESLEATLAQELIANRALQAATANSVLSGASDDVVARVRNMFRLEEGAAVGRRPDGTLLVNQQGQNMSVHEYVTALREEAPHLFNKPQGSGNTTGNGMRTPADGGGPKVMQAGGNETFLDNLEKIAKGEVVLDHGGDNA